MTRPRAGYVGFNRVPTATAASGVWTLREAESNTRSGTWPKPAGGDTLFSSVVLLLHMEGSGSSFSDSSSANKTITAGGNATQSTTQYKFGSKALYCDGTGDYISAPSITLSGDFTAEAWIRWNGSISKNYSAIMLGSSANTQFFLTTKVNRTGLRFGLTGVAEFATGSFTWSADTWYHVAVVRDSNAIRLYVDGSNVTDSSPTTSQSFSGELRIGGDGAVTYDSDIYLDEVRVTTAKRYTGSSFAVPTAAFPDL